MNRISGIIKNEIAGATNTPLFLTESIFNRGENRMASQTISNPCVIPGCGKRRHGWGYCDNHYRLWQRNGDPLTKKVDPTLTDEQRFWQKVQKTETCWLWMGGRQGKGHGLAWVNGKNEKAHRYSFFLAHGKWPDKWALHKCDNPPCVNPDHLYDGTPQDNSDDKFERGRAVIMRGEDNKRSKLRNADVLEIRRLLSLGVTQRALGTQFGVNQRVIWAIANRRSWAHIPVVSETT